MLESITIERFKSIAKAELELGRVNMFIGGNGAGKSNALEAIGVTSAAAGRGLTDADFLQRGVRLTPPQLMRSAFTASSGESFTLSVRMFGDVQYQVTLTASARSSLVSSESCRHNGSMVFERGPDYVRGVFDERLGTVAEMPALLSVDRGMWDQVRATLRVPIDVRNALDTLAQYAIYSPQAHFLRGMQVAQAGAHPSSSAVGLHGEGLPAAVGGLIDQHHSTDEASRERKLKFQGLGLAFLPGWADLVQVAPIDDERVSKAVVQDKKGHTLYFLDKYMTEERRMLSAYDSSEGTLFLLFVAVLLAHDDSPKIFALDNADDALNPSMTRKLLETVIEITKTSSTHNMGCGPRQVFLTSHNPTALDAFDLFDDDQRVFVVARNSCGQTEIERLKPAKGITREQWTELQDGRNLSQLWIEGAIDGALGPADL